MDEGRNSNNIADSKLDEELLTFVNSLSEDQEERVMNLIREKRTRHNEKLKERLPREMWIMILDNLCLEDLLYVSMTCKSFREISLDALKTCWNEWSVRPGDLLQYPESHATLFSRMSSSLELHISEDWFDDDDDDHNSTVKVPKEACDRLKTSFKNVKIHRLNLDLYKYQSVYLDICTSTIRNVKEIDLGLSEVYDRHLEAIANSCPDLEMFSLENPRHITDVGIESIASRCPKLTKFSLNKYYEDPPSLPMITDKGIITLVPSAQT